MSKPRLVLIDGNSLLYRAFFALPVLTDPQKSDECGIRFFTDVGQSI